MQSSSYHDHLWSKYLVGSRLLVKVFSKKLILAALVKHPKRSIQVLQRFKSIRIE